MACVPLIAIWYSSPRAFILKKWTFIKPTPEYIRSVAGLTLRAVFFIALDGIYQNQSFLPAAKLAVSSLKWIAWKNLLAGLITKVIRGSWYFPQPLFQFFLCKIVYQDTKETWRVHCIRRDESTNTRTVFATYREYNYRPLPTSQWF